MNQGYSACASWVETNGEFAPRCQPFDQAKDYPFDRAKYSPTAWRT
jgi:hypothetical protein